MPVRQMTHRSLRRRDAKLRRRVVHQQFPAHTLDRSGSTLMIVIVLLGLLSVLGVVFYTFANQERSNAEYYADAAKVVEAPGLTADELMDFGMEQLIIGPRPNYKNSVLWGKRHSLVGNAVGVKDPSSLGDLTAFDGQGVLLSQTPGIAPFVDQDQDGTADTGQVLDRQGQAVFTNANGSNIQHLKRMVDSPAAHNLFERETGRMPQPDVGYTYPDINNTFLAYVGWVRDRNGGRLRRVVIPSFHRPQLYRDAGGQPIPLWEDRNYNGSIDGGEDRNSSSALDAGSDNPAEQFRAHPNHVYVPPGQTNGTPTSRYIFTATEAASRLGDGKRVFPFLPMYTGYNPTSGGTDVTLSGITPGWVGHQGVWSGPHPDDSTYADPDNILHDDYQYDVDNDNDGIREGVWLDLDFPVQELSDGTLYIPMFSFTVYELDSLLNLNVHGNAQNVLFDPTNFAFNNTANQLGFNAATGQLDWISASNMGSGPSEVNPAWALTARANVDNTTASTTVFAQYQAFFGNFPADATSFGALRASFQETANMDLAFLKFGRPEVAGSVVDDLYPGVWGEEHLIARYFSAGANNPVNFPHPGQSLSDDNGDINEGMQFQPQFVSGTTNTWLDVDQPFDAVGMGRMNSLNMASLPDPKAMNFFPTAGVSRVKWLRYEGYANNGAITWGNAGIQTGMLQTNNQSYGRFDEPDEVALYAEARRDVDDPFTAEDAAFLQLSNDDINQLGLKSRLTDLASFNFSTSTNTNSRGEAIRKKFTTVSNDRKNFALPSAIGDTGRPWEWNDDNGQSFTNTSDKVRFPPVFGAAGTAISRYSTADPFRSPTRYLLAATSEDLQVQQYQRRLAINQLLVYDWQSSNSTELVYRDLTLHPLDPGATPIPTTAPTYQPGYPWTSAANQEFWARRDRQWLARDIYVLLYLMGGSADATSSLDHTGSAIGPQGYLKSNAANELYTDEQMEQMARFAVNLVDAQDKDRVSTRFEYDTDLSNGWNLDDNPYTPNTAVPNEPDALGATDRAEVWGVERQELTFSEALVFQTVAEDPSNGLGGMGDSMNTEHDDNEERQFLTVELRNLAPYNIAFDDSDRWQIVLRQFEPSEAMYDPALERRLTLRAGSGTVTAGGFYTIFTTDREDSGSSANDSAFRVDPDGMSGAQWIVPRDTAFAGAATAAGSHIDLVEAATGGMAPFTITDGASSPTDLTGTAGSFLTDGAPVTGGGMGNFVLDRTENVHIILRRRAHPTRTRPTNSTDEEDNPWVEVDRFIFSDGGGGGFPVFDYPNTGSDATMQLQQLRSEERREPLDRGTDQHASGNIANTFISGPNAENSNAPGTQFRIYQTHYDRQFTSLADVLNLPLVGPPSEGSDDRTDGLTLFTSTMRDPPDIQYGTPGSSLLYSTDLQNFPKSASAMFLVPNNPTSTDVPFDNRWHRVLEMLEVPTRQHRNLGMGTEFEITRVPGKINLNALRSPEILAALIDNEQILDIHPANGSTTYPALRNMTDTALDTFVQLQASRDPKDTFWETVAGSPDLRLPGLAPDPIPAGGDLTAYPFRSLSFTAAGNRSVEHTVLRDLPDDVENSRPDRRHLFEIGDNGEHTNGTLDLALRHQVLSKIWNNTTTRSNAFVVFSSVKLFRADVDAVTGAVKIGGPLKEFSATEQRPELPEYRGVFVVDRSLLEQGASTGGGGFNNFHPFVTYRKILKEE